jgi:PAT family beta-lactamase induction signal transducer AmpG
MSQPSAWRALLSRRMLICVFTGFSSGLPLYLLLYLVPVWLKTEGLSLKAIGAFTLIQFPYIAKFLWSPLLDRYTVSAFGRRRSWMLGTHLALIAAMEWLGQLSPKDDLRQVVLTTVIIAFLSATLDIVLDAFRRELLHDEELGLGSAVHVNAYKLAGFVPGSLALILADHLPWGQVFVITALFMLPGFAMTLLVREPVAATIAPHTLREAVVEPFHEFFSRNGVKTASLILAFILLYKLGDSLCTALATPFYLDMGFTKTNIGLVAKNAGVWPSVIGGLIGGLWMVRTGINRALWLFGVVQMIAILGFACLAWLGAAPPDASRLAVLAVVIGLEALGVGLGTAAFVAFIARNTHPAYTATQLALFTSLMAVPRTLINASAGWLIEGFDVSARWIGNIHVPGMGYFNFFLLCFVLAIPGMLLLLKVAPWGDDPAHTTLQPSVI